MLEFFQDDDVTLLTELGITNFQAGLDSDVIVVHLWHSMGDPTAQDLTDLALAISTEDPAAAGEFLRSGVAPQDELWPRVRFVGQDNTADPTQEDFRTDWTPLGAYRVLPFPSLHAGCARYLEIKFRPPGIATEAPWSFQLAVLHSEHSVALQVPVGELGSGIVSGVGDRRANHLVRGGEVTVSAPADDEVHVAARHFIHGGVPHGQVATSITLDQDDVAAEALAVGESYWAVLSLGPGGVTATKGARAADPDKPGIPVDEIFLRYVKVDHQAGGTSVIELQDLDGETLYGRHLAVPGNGLEVRVHPGTALGGGSWRYWTRLEPLPLEPDATTYLWQTPDGLYQTTTDATPPSDAALGPWAEITTDATQVTALVDRRAYAGRCRVLTLRGAPPGAPGLVADLLVTDSLLYIERVVLRASDNGGGTAGATVIDVTRTRDGVGETLYTSFATDDQRPTIAFDAADLVDRDGVAEVLELRDGDVLSFATVQHPTGGTPAELEVNIFCRVP